MNKNNNSYNKRFILHAKCQGSISYYLNIVCDKKEDITCLLSCKEILFFHANNSLAYIQKKKKSKSKSKHKKKFFYTHIILLLGII